MPKPSAPVETPDLRNGFWNTSLSAEQVTQSSVALDQIQLGDNAVYWRESRPGEEGRFTLCRWTESAGVEYLLEAPFNVRSRVHEYGGGEWCLGTNQLYFVNATDQQIYEYDLNGTTNPRQVTNKTDTRFADLQYDGSRHQLLCVSEEHCKGGKVINCLVSVCITNGQVEILHQGFDFYASPAIASDGRHLAWLSWNHPHMPWVSTRLCLAERSEQGRLHNIIERTGDLPSQTADTESFFQPQFGPDGKLYCISDRSGWWNIHCFDSQVNIKNVCERNAEFGLAQWCFGLRTYDFLDNDTLAASYMEDGEIHLSLIARNGECQPLKLDFNFIRGIRCRGNDIYCIAASASRLSAIVRINAKNGKTDILQGGDQPISDACLSRPRHFSYTVELEEQAHGYFYPPKNPAAPQRERPPVIIFTHGGPTASTYPVLNPKIQYWTQRGFAVADLNYRGSAGYGRDYRQALHLRWGDSDVKDCIAAIDYLAEHGLVDEENVFIRGNSAGGYTTLCALTFTRRFKAGSSLYGISDPARLNEGTHKFESHYLEWLIGDVEKDADRYRDRTPLFHAEKVCCPILFFQGALDKVVLPDQTLDMVEKLKAKGIRADCHMFSDEYHGFQKPRNQQIVLEEELQFYQDLLSRETPASFS